MTLAFGLAGYLPKRLPITLARPYPLREEKILSHVLLLLALTFPITGHSWSELNDWLTDYDQRYETAWMLQEDLTDLDAELAGMLDRHPGWDGTIQTPPPVPVAHAPAGSSAPGRGMGTGVEQWRSLVSAYFPADQVERALCIMSHESNGNPSAKNSRSTAAGLFQFLKSTWDTIVPADVSGGSYDSGQVYNPDANVRSAAWLQGAIGWTQWSPYQRGLCR